MSYEESFYYHWNSIPKLEIPDPLDRTICVYALSFQKWVDELSNMMQNPSDIGVNQAKILLADKYFDWERLVPQSHRMRLGVHGHTCIYQVFKKAYENLRIMELHLTPPRINFPPPPPPMKILPRPNLAGIMLGEDTEDDES